ncbi:MAG: SPFH domain-containing protein [Lachnospiraceae bacterium]|nr:SPFH domain-containing protein [Lachnospiraceae bacterium]
MGLISAITAAAGSALADSWREYFYCESMNADVMIVKGEKRVGGKSSNKKGSDNIISNGSIIAVNEGQCMIIVEQGKVADVCAEPGEFVWDSSTEPSIFYGSLGENIKKSFMQIGRRFTFGGDTAKDQRVYYVNTKELVGNKYGTANPVPFRVVDKNIGLDVDIAIRCHGEYSYRIVDPVLFYTHVAGNVTNEYTRDKIDSQLKSELMTALQPAFAKISEMGIRYSALPGHTTEIADALNEVLSQKWGELRGLAVVSFGVNSVTASEEDEKMIKELQKNAVLTNPAMAAATLTAAQASAMQAAASNESTGPMMAFAGMNMANMAGGMNANNLYGMAAAQQAAPQQAAPQPAAPAAAVAGWTCACGKTGNTGKFCAECGAPQPSADGWTCTCGTVNKGKFCSNCGAKKPAGAPVYKCDKCGWEPEDKTNPPKFCPECGDVFDDNDKI